MFSLSRRLPWWGRKPKAQGSFPALLQEPISSSASLAQVIVKYTPLLTSAEYWRLATPATLLRVLFLISNANIRMEAVVRCALPVSLAMLPTFTAREVVELAVAVKRLGYHCDVEQPEDVHVPTSSNRSEGSEEENPLFTALLESVACAPQWVTESDDRQLIMAATVLYPSLQYLIDHAAFREWCQAASLVDAIALLSSWQRLVDLLLQQQQHISGRQDAFASSSSCSVGGALPPIAGSLAVPRRIVGLLTSSINHSTSFSTRLLLQLLHDFPFFYSERHLSLGVRTVLMLSNFVSLGSLTSHWEDSGSSGGAAGSSGVSADTVASFVLEFGVGSLKYWLKVQQQLHQLQVQSSAKRKLLFEADDDGDTGDADQMVGHVFLFSPSLPSSKAGAKKEALDTLDRFNSALEQLKERTEDQIYRSCNNRELLLQVDELNDAEIELERKMEITGGSNPSHSTRSKVIPLAMEPLFMCVHDGRRGGSPGGSAAVVASDRSNNNKSGDSDDDEFSSPTSALLLRSLSLSTSKRTALRIIRALDDVVGIGSLHAKEALYVLRALGVHRMLGHVPSLAPAAAGGDDASSTGSSGGEGERKEAKRNEEHIITPLAVESLVDAIAARLHNAIGGRTPELRPVYLLVALKALAASKTAPPESLSDGVPLLGFGLTSLADKIILSLSASPSLLTTNLIPFSH